MMGAGASTRASTHPSARPTSTQPVRTSTLRANPLVRASTQGVTSGNAPPRVRTCAPLVGGTVHVCQFGVCWERSTRLQTKVEMIQKPSSILPNSDHSPPPHATIRATTSARGMASMAERIQVIPGGSAPPPFSLSAPGRGAIRAATPGHSVPRPDPSDHPAAQRITNPSRLPSPQVLGVGIAPCQQQVNRPRAAA